MNRSLLATAAACLAATELGVVSVTYQQVVADLPGSGRLAPTLLLASYPAVFAGMLLIGGWLAERVGANRGTVYGLVALGAASALCGVSWNIDSLIIFRILQAGSAAVIVASSLALISLSVDPPDRPRAVAAWVTAQAVALAVGPPIFALLDLGFGWRSLFLAQVPIALVLGAALLTTGPGPRQTASRSGFSLRDSASVGLIGLGIVVVAGAKTPTALVLALAVSSIAVGVVAIASTPSRSNWSAVLNSRQFRLPLWGLSAIGAAFIALFLRLTTAVESLGASTAMTVGLSLLPFTLGIAAGSFLARIALRTVTPSAVAAVASSSAAAAALALALTTIESSSSATFKALWLTWTAVAGIGIGGSMPVFNGMALAVCPPALVPVAGGLLQTARQVAGAFLAALVLRFDSAPTDTVGMTIVSITALLAAGIAVLAHWQIAKD